MTKAEQTRRFIIEKSALVFNTKGYLGTSLSDLVEVTGLTKGSIYGNFENKDSVAIAVYQYNIKVLNKRISEFLTDKKTAYDKLIGFTDYYRTYWKMIFEKGGCPILNAAVEADDNLTFLKKHVQLSVKNWVGYIEQIIAEGQKHGEFRKKIDASKYAYTIITVLEGGIMLGKIMNDQHLLFLALDRIVLIIDQDIKKK